ncbi:hypothetical protein [Caloranaerobacter sp. DY30410]|uniref:hypothetical protein n=1 Tax=Caloranaerobacter sp. DY30410 TaxID=3238305 RepID=UPI003D0313A4
MSIKNLCSRMAEDSISKCVEMLFMDPYYKELVDRYSALFNELITYIPAKHKKNLLDKMEELEDDITYLSQLAI